jgi:hypothetical protein
MYAHAVLILHGGDDRDSAYEGQTHACRGIIAIEVRKLLKMVDFTPCRGVSDPNFAYRHSVDRDRILLVFVSEFPLAPAETYSSCERPAAQLQYCIWRLLAAFPPGESRRRRQAQGDQEKSNSFHDSYLWGPEEATNLAGEKSSA